MARRFLLAFTVAVLTLVSQAESARTQEIPTPFGILVADWTADMDVIEQIMRVTELTPEGTETVKRNLAQVIAEAGEARTRANALLTDLTARLDALGPPPEGPDAVPEPDAVTTERARLALALSEAKSEVALAELTIARASALEARIGQEQRSRLFARLTDQGPLPYLPDTLAQAPASVAAFLSGIATIASDWWSGLMADRRAVGGFLPVSAIVLTGLILAWWTRRFLLRRFGPHPVDEPPPYGRRLVAAVAEGIAQGIVPAAILGVILARTQTDGSALHGEFGDLVGFAAGYLMIFVLITALPHAALAPDDPEWRLTQLAPEQGRQIFRLATPLALLFCIDEFVTRTAADLISLQGVLTPEFLSVWTFGFNLVQGGLALALLRPSLWSGVPLESDAADADGDEDPPPGRGLKGPFLHLLHMLLVAATLIGMAAPALGYAALGNYLMNNMLGTAVVLAVLSIFRGLCREGIGLATGSAFLRDRLALPHATRSRAKLALRFILDIAIVALGFAVVAPNWGVSETDLWRWTRGILDGLTVGSVTISPTDILLGVAVFFAAMAAIRAIRHQVTERVLTETGVEDSLRHSIGAGISYLGFVVAAALAIAVAGVDLTNVALIAGALSVGIGFGLQNIVNNFVSGMILLIERPIKVGDWVVVGGNEGFVKQINMRATEIETWRKASVIVPNADLLSTALTNWTHKDKIGRVDVPIGVALDSDVDKVCDILVEIGRAHPQCRRVPEPVALVMAVGDSRIELELRIFTSDILWVLWIASDLRRSILRRFRDEGIVIPPPQREVAIKPGTDPNDAAAGAS